MFPLRTYFRAGGMIPKYRRIRTTFIHTYKARECTECTASTFPCPDILGVARIFVKTEREPRLLRD